MNWCPDLGGTIRSATNYWQLRIAMVRSREKEKVLAFQGKSSEG